MSLPSLSSELGELGLVSHTIDPEGEVIIVLQNAHAPFAVWPEDPPTKEQLTAPQPQTQTTSTGKNTKNKEIRFKVSAKHLKLASPVFAKALSPKWSEGSTLQDKGFVEIVVDGWDSDALLILLNIFHCKFSMLPGKLTVELLAKIAVLADYYQCLPVIEIFAFMWIRGMNPPFPKSYGRDLMLLLLICSIFGVEKDRKKLSLLAVKQSTGLIPTLGLPFPGTMIADLNSKRVKVIGHIIDAMHAKVDHMIRFDNVGWLPELPPAPLAIRQRFKPLFESHLQSSPSPPKRSRTSSSPCPGTPQISSPSSKLGINYKRTCFDCTSSKLGAMIKQMHEISLSPKPKLPYDGLSYEGLVKSVNGIKQCQRTQGHERCISFLEFLKPFASQLWTEVGDMLKDEA